MRAGPLSDNDTIATLNKSFVNAWILDKEVRKMGATTPAGDARRLADAVIPALKEGSPVDSLIFTAELKLVAVQSANDSIAAAFGKDGAGVPGYVRRYRDFLEEGIAKASKVQ